jgi:hypothetical protein
VSSSQLTRNACWGWAHTRSRHGHAIDHPLADQADITHSQTYLACEHCGAGQDSPRVHAQADLAVVSKTVCQQPIPSSGWNTSPRSAGAPHRPASRIALADRSTPNAGTPRPNQAGSQTARTTTQFDHRPPHIATRASAAISFLSNPGGVLTTDASSHPAETTNLRKLRCPVTRRGFDVV